MKINFLKLTTVFAITLLFAATTVSAQDASSTKVPQKGKVYKAEHQQLTPEQKASKMTEKLTEELGLNEEQVSAIYEINLSQIQRMDELRTQNIEDRKEKMEARKAIMEETKLQNNEQLTDEQAAKLAEWESKRQEARQSRRGRGRMGGKRISPAKN